MRAPSQPYLLGKTGLRRPHGITDGGEGGALSRGRGQVSLSSALRGWVLAPGSPRSAALGRTAHLLSRLPAPLAPISGPGFPSLPFLTNE